MTLTLYYAANSAPTLGSRSTGGPKVISSPPKPDKWSVKDTSVNIATAFNQAATDMNPTHTNPNNSWVSTSRNLNVPRSTSVEYEATAPTAFNRKHLAPPPPDRLGRATTTARKPPSKTPSVRHVPDSEGEDDGRGRSPFERVVDLGKQALSQATFYVQQRSMSREPEELSVEQTPAVNGKGNEPSYDYADEEDAYQATQNKRHTVAQKRGRISVDNKAYKPPLSESESELSDDGKTRRKKKKKGGPTGGPLSTLPVLLADKAKKKKKKTQRKNQETQEDESESEEISQQIDIVCTSIPIPNPTSEHPFSNHYNELQYPGIRTLLSPKFQIPTYLRNPVTTMAMFPWKAPSKAFILYQKSMNNFSTILPYSNNNLRGFDHERLRRGHRPRHQCFLSVVYSAASSTISLKFSYPSSPLSFPS